MKYKFLFAALVVLSASIIIYSCKKEEEKEPDTDTQSAIDYTKADEAASSTFSTVNHYGINQEQIKNMTDLRAGVVITVDTIGNASNNFWPRRLTLDFGTTGILCYDGHTRKGKFIAEFSNHWRPDTIVQGTNVVITFQDFYLDMVQRQGTFTVTYNGIVNGGPSYTIDAVNAMLTFSNGDEVSWTSTRTINWVEGYTTTGQLPADLNDDVFETTGTCSGVNRKGIEFDAEITTPLRIEKSCQFGITKGVLEITPKDKATRTVDYGDGECDGKAKLSVNGVSINFVFGS